MAGQDLEWLTGRREPRPGLAVSQLWTSQALVADCSGFEKHKLFGVYGGVIEAITIRLEAIAILGSFCY